MDTCTVLRYADITHVGGLTSVYCSIMLMCLLISPIVPFGSLKARSAYKISLFSVFL